MIYFLCVQWSMWEVDRLEFSLQFFWSKSKNSWHTMMNFLSKGNSWHTEMNFFIIKILRIKKIFSVCHDLKLSIIFRLHCPHPISILKPHKFQFLIFTKFVSSRKLLKQIQKSSRMMSSAGWFWLNWNLSKCKIQF